ncbi:MAG: MGMT family protein [Clostridia bacterium]|nr:MGMT family protein [Clostridia bacterium]MBR3991821.1 MGMT family protein [Clostridia bacterium]MBR6291016.1 MGMT family protein [Clostridia bacterium]
MKKVWRVLRRIPYGEVLTYGEVAEAAGSPRGARAVGGAVGRNPLIIVVPCHRVVAKDGLGGFSGEGGLELKRKLLEIEKNAGDF